MNTYEHRDLSKDFTLCRKALQQDQFTGAVFVFRNRLETGLMLVTYNGQGFWLSDSIPTLPASPGGTRILSGQLSDRLPTNSDSTHGYWFKENDNRSHLLTLHASGNQK